MTHNHPSIQSRRDLSSPLSSIRHSFPSDTPFYNDFITYWNTYLSEKIKDILMPYTDWYRESFILTLNPEL